MAALDLITLADLKVYGPIGGAQADAALKQFITAASRLIEGDLGRRIVYRAPPDTAASTIVNAQAFGTGAIAVAAQPASGGRTLIVAFSAATSGTLTIVGTVAGVSKTVVFDAANGLSQHGTDFFTAIASVTGAAGTGTVTVTSSAGYLDYHTANRRAADGHFSGADTMLSLYEWPGQQLLEVNEDPARVYGTSTKLVQGTDYILSRPNDGDVLIRQATSSPFSWSWLPGWRAVRVTYSAGYTVATVPEEIKDACRRLAYLMWQEKDRGQIEVASGSNALGSWARMGPASLTRTMRQALTPYRRNRFGSDTAERDFDLEAA